jgi:hypothetical protein
MSSISRFLLLCLVVGSASGVEDEPKASLSDIDPAHPLAIPSEQAIAIENPQLRNWNGYNTYRITVVNQGTEPADLTFEITDTPGRSQYWDRHVDMASLKPGENVIDTDFSGGLYRGEPTSHWRGTISTPIEIDKIARLTFYNGSKHTIAVTRVEVVKVKQLTTPGGFAFDFGGERSAVMRQFIGITPSTLYVADKKFGFVGGPGKTIAKEMTWPTPMLGDGVAFPVGGFQVDLDGGAYIGFVAFERGGYWGPQEGCQYDHLAFTVNGAVAHEHDFSRSGLHFFFEDTEISDLAQVPERLVFPANALSRFRFKAAKGANVFAVDVRNPIGWIGPRVAGLVLAPESDDGREFIETHLALQRQTINDTFAPTDRSQREGRQAPDKPLVYAVLPIGAEVLPKDYPGANRGKPPAEILAVTGQTVCIHLGIYTQKNGMLTVTAPPARNADRNLGEAKISYGCYMPDRYQVGSTWLSINHYRPEPTFTVGPELSRSLIIAYQVPIDAKGGNYGATISLAGAGPTLTVPITIRVIPAKLAEIPIPVGLLVNSMMVGPESLDSETYWRLTESIVREQMSAGLNVLTHGPAYVYKDGTISGDLTLRYLRLAQKYGPIKALVNYGSLYATPTMAELPTYVAAIKRFEEVNHLPPHYFNCYDEPQIESAITAATELAAAIVKAGGRSIGETSEHWDAPFAALWAKMVEATYAPACNIHEPTWFSKVKAMGRHPWVYNQGRSRAATGIYFWRQIKLGAEGRIDWIGFNTQGFAFNNLDGREPALAQFAVHSTFGVLETPAWLSRREGLLDCRIRLTLEALAKADDPALKIWPADEYREEASTYTDAQLEEWRVAMLQRLSELSPP